jgi:hypothetical protein
MSAQCEVSAQKAARAKLGPFERYLTTWVTLYIVVGIALGHLLPGVFQTIGSLAIAQVNLLNRQVGEAHCVSTRERAEDDGPERTSNHPQSTETPL